MKIDLSRKEVDRLIEALGDERGRGKVLTRVLRALENRRDEHMGKRFALKARREA